MKSLWNSGRRAAAVAAVAAVGAAFVGVPSHAADRGVPSVTVTDRPGAPGEALRQLDDLAGQPPGVLDEVKAVDAGGAIPTVEQLRALVAGEDVDGVKVLGVLPGGRELLDTTMADLSDGRYDGPSAEGPAAATLLFATSDPITRDWCITMCVSSGKSVWECIKASRRTTLEFSGDTTFGGAKAGLERGTSVPVGEIASVENLVGDSELSNQDIETLLSGKRVDSLRTVGIREWPDPTSTLGDAGTEFGVMKAKQILRIFTFTLPVLGNFVGVCESKDRGKTWRCSARQWNGF